MCIRDRYEDALALEADWPSGSVNLGNPVSYTHLDVYKRQGYINARAIRLDPYLDVVIHHPLDWNKYLQCCSPLSGKSMNTPFDIPCAQPYPDHTGEYGDCLLYTSRCV